MNNSSTHVQRFPLFFLVMSLAILAAVYAVMIRRVSNELVAVREDLVKARYEASKNAFMYFSNTSKRTDNVEGRILKIEEFVRKNYRERHGSPVIFQISTNAVPEITPIQYL